MVTQTVLQDLTGQSRDQECRIDRDCMDDTPAGESPGCLVGRQARESGAHGKSEGFTATGRTTVQQSAAYALNKSNAAQLWEQG